MPVIPIFMPGLGKALPKGAVLLVRFFVDVFVGEPVPWEGDRDRYLQRYRTDLARLSEEGSFAPWT